MIYNQIFSVLCQANLTFLCSVALVALYLSLVIYKIFCLVLFLFMGIKPCDRESCLLLQNCPDFSNFPKLPLLNSPSFSGHTIYNYFIIILVLNKLQNLNLRIKMFLPNFLLPKWCSKYISAKTADFYKLTFT